MEKLESKSLEAQQSAWVLLHLFQVTVVVRALSASQVSVHSYAPLDEVAERRVVRSWMYFSSAVKPAECSVYPPGASGSGSSPFVAPLLASRLLRTAIMCVKLV